MSSYCIPLAVIAAKYDPDGDFSIEEVVGVFCDDAIPNEWISAEASPYINQKEGFLMVNAAKDVDVQEKLSEMAEFLATVVGSGGLITEADLQRNALDGKPSLTII